MTNKSYDYFMKMDTTGFIDEWVAIVDSTVASHGKDVKKVFKEAKEKYPEKRPLIARIPGKEVMIW
jgi:hypothetical protein